MLKYEYVGVFCVYKLSHAGSHVHHVLDGYNNKCF